MDNHQIALVQQSFDKAAEPGEAVAELFYAELFALDPSLRRMFTGDMAEQGRKLLSTLTMVVKGLNQPDKIIPAAENLAVKHLDYGVTYEHYTLVGTALLSTLEKGLGPDSTPAVREAWTAAYQLLSDVMRNAAYGPDMRLARQAG